MKKTLHTECLMEAIEDVRGECDDRMVILEKRIDGLMRTLELLEFRVLNLRNEA